MAVTCTDETAFLQAVLDNPDDDAVRLVYADWLEEHPEFVGTIGLARARIIRIDQAVSTDGAEAAAARGLTFVAKQNLIRKYAQHWLHQPRKSTTLRPEVPDSWEPNWTDLVYAHDWRLGFPEAIRTTQTVYHQSKSYVTRLVREHPLRRIILADAAAAATDDKKFYWYNQRGLAERLRSGQPAEYPHHLDPSVFVHLHDYVRAHNNDFTNRRFVSISRYYPDAVAAQYALARACVLHARSLAAGRRKK